MKTDLETRLIAEIVEKIKFRAEQEQQICSKKGLFHNSLLITGMRGCLPGWVLAELYKSVIRTSGKDESETAKANLPLIVVITPSDARAYALAEEIRLFLGDSPFGEDHMKIPWATVLPHNAKTPFEDTGSDMELELERMGVLFRLSQGFMGPFLFLSAVSLGQLFMPRNVFADMCDVVGPGQEMDRQDLIRSLDCAGYRRMPLVEDPGCYGVRGAIVDIYSPAMSGPTRVEFDGDRIVDLRRFHPESQRTVSRMSMLYLHPVRQTILTVRGNPRLKLGEAAELCGCPSSKANFILDNIRDGTDFFGSESMLPAFHEKLESLESYLPRNSVFVVEDRAGVLTEMEALRSYAEAIHRDRIEMHRISFGPEDFFLEEEEYKSLLNRRTAVRWFTHAMPAWDDLNGEEVSDDISAFEESRFDLETEGHLVLAAETQRMASEKGGEILAPLAREIRKWRESGLEVTVAVSNKRNADRLESVLKGYGIAVSGWGGNGTARGEGVFIRTGNITGGFLWFGGGACTVSENELLGVGKKRASTPRSKSQPSTDLSRLKEGDYVVHEIHGVGRYGGLTRQVMGDVPADFLVIHYAENDKLYLPVHRFSLVQRYVGGGGERGPKLDRLGGRTWEKKKKKVSEDVNRLAEQLLKTQAQRSALTGHNFGNGGEIMTAFETTFPFEETPDQAAAIRDVISDMMSSAPMDRLVCGDVGYGKTEVAMRAAVLAVLDGKQAALLAPTAVLVEQHFAGFKERLRSFPITIDALSRFRGAKKQAKTLEALSMGAVDIVVGTHRLLSSDVRFKDLGLVIIDEEQRFGVAQKEKLKNMRSLVDVLSLTATPIPRTMQMALSGLRDMSVIATPPPDRRAVHTYVCPYSPSTVVRAIRQELERGGQVFFVVPKIGDDGSRGSSKELDDSTQKSGITSIKQWAEQIQQWLPQARVVTAHGRMENRHLEKVMVEFVNGAHDVLVATSLIESGLDIPRANTMLVMQADRFGLAQLYQLRGRIGRSSSQAYCYFMADTLTGLTEKATQRLAALERLSRLGSAFNLATEDLEIRGAGDVMGKKQSGQVAAVGFETYFNMLEESVAALKGESIEREKDCDLSYDIPAYFPDDWVCEPSARLHYYQAMAHCEDAEAVASLIAEMEDLFGGPVPEEAVYLAQLTIAKLQAKNLGAESLEISKSRLMLTIGEESPLAPAEVLKLMQSNARYKLRPPRQLLKRLASESHKERVEEIKNSLKELEGCVTRIC